MATIHLMDVDATGNKKTRCGRAPYKGIGYTGNEAWVTCPECLKKIEEGTQKYVICHVKSGRYVKTVEESTKYTSVMLTIHQFASKFKKDDAQKMCEVMPIMGLGSATEFAIEEAT